MKYLWVITGVVLAACEGWAAEPTYWQDVRPILRKHCTVCHNERNRTDLDLSGGLALDSPAAIAKGGKTAVMKPGDAADSLLIKVLRHPKKERRMPLDADPLPDETVTMLKRWIETGAKEGVAPKEADTTAASRSSLPARRLDVVLGTKLQKPPRFELALPIGPLAPIAAVAYSPDGRWLAVGSYGRVTIWDTQAARAVQFLSNVLGAVNDLKFSPDGALLAVAGGQPSARGDLRLFRTSDWQLAATLGGHADVVACVAFRSDGRLLASASYDKTVRIWDVPAKKLLRTLTGHSDFVHSVAFEPKGEWLASVSKDRTVRITDVATGNSRMTFSGMDSDVLAVAVSPDGQQVVSSGYEAGLFWWNAKTGERTRRQNGHDIAVHELSFDRAGKMVASAGADKTVRLWVGTTGEPLRTFRTETVIYSVAMKPDGSQVAAGGFDGLVRIWETNGIRQLVTLCSSGSEWIAATPEGYVGGSDSLLARGTWRSAGQGYASDVVRPTLAKPEQVVRAWKGDKMLEPSLPPPVRKPQ